MIIKSIKSSIKTLRSALPIMGGVLLIVSYINIFVDKYYEMIFTNNDSIDLLIGSIAGSISFGMPITSYVIGGELQNKGVGLLAVTAFIISWTTVGIAMLPLEAKYLGKKFAIARNAVNFIFSMIIAVLVVFTISIF